MDHMCCECRGDIDYKKRDRERERKGKRRGREGEREREREGEREREREREREEGGESKTFFFTYSAVAYHTLWLQSRWRVMIEAATQCLP